MKQPFLFHLTAIRDTPGASVDLQCSGEIEGLRVSGSSVPSGQPVSITGEAQSLEGPRVVVTGSVRAAWQGDCRRCLGTARGVIDQSVREIFEPEPVEGETYQLLGQAIDLGLLVRDAVLLELPEAPLCKPDCAGLCPECGVNRNETTCECTTSDIDPRWSALDVLRDE